MFDKTQENERNWIDTRARARKDFSRRGRVAAALTTILMTVLPLTTFGQSRPAAITGNAYHFVNVVDNTQGFSFFGSAPAINNDSAVAFESAGTGFEFGSVWKWYDGSFTSIATSANGILGTFGDVVVINSAGTVGFSSRVLNGNDSIIATGAGGPLNTIVSAHGAGLLGGQFLGISAMNERGDVVFLGVRTGFSSQAIFKGRGGPVTPIIDTLTNSNFGALGNADINAGGKIVFRGFLADGNEGIFLSDGGVKDVIDTNNPNVVDFLDPVINNRGTVGTAAFLSVGGQTVFTADASGITLRTDASFFSFIDNVSVNNQNDVAFFATETTGRNGIFVELTGSNNAVPVIETGDALFGSTVVEVSVGRFSLNDGGQITFRYRLADGRSGIAVASR
jgi:hypothetical protein